MRRIRLAGQLAIPDALVEIEAVALLPRPDA
jgi:hypothetical protein